MSQPWRGIFPIVVTPFTEAGAVDETSLQRVVRFCIEAGARGLVGPANASEFTTLSDAERRRWLEVVVETAGGEIPVVASVTSGHAFPAAALARRARGRGRAGARGAAGRGGWRRRRRRALLQAPRGVCVAPAAAAAAVAE